MPNEALQKLVAPKGGGSIQLLREIGGIHRIIQRIAARRGESAVKPGAALAGALLTKFGVGNLLVGRVGEDEVLRRIGDAIRVVRREMTFLINDAVPTHLRSETTHHNDVSSQTDPAALMEYVMPDDQDRPEEHHIARERLRSKHARVMLTLGVIGFLIELVDETSWIERDLKELADTVHYEPNMRNVTVVAGLSCDSGVRAVAQESTRVFLAEQGEERDVYKERVRKLSRGLYESDFLCRQAEVNGKTFYVYHNTRPKDLFARILKLLRSHDKPERHLRDNRGIKDVVVAVRENGELLAGTREHVIEWEEYVKGRIFGSQDIFQEEFEKLHHGATHGGLHYWDRKVYGRIVRWREGYKVGGRFEWIGQGIGDYLKTLVTATAEHHDVYVMKRFWLDFLPLAFPHREWGGKNSNEYDQALARWLRIVEARLSS